ncbi:hypothetical protein GGI12_002340 [Dipsacomyces acuminosporus]|nr:hypothetical protein GGI12_002340 [Dipsacomyces acuminosporus]
MKDADARSLSSSCRRVTLGTRRPQWAHSLWGRLLWMLWKWIARVDDKIEGEIWELSMWTPNTFSRNLFCWCSPVQLLILSFMDGSNWYYILPLSAAVATQCTFLVVTYATLVKDKQLLFSEVYNEYNQKFVHPRVFVPKRDAATSTLEDWIEARKDAAANTDSNIAAARAWRIGRVHERRATTMATQEIDPRGYLPNDAAEPVSREHRREMGRSKDVPPPITSNTDTRARDHHLRRTTMYTGPARASDEFGDFENEHEGPQPSYSSAGHPQHVPSGTQKIRDRSAKRRRHTEIVERMRREK